MIQVGDEIGAFNTVLLVILTAVIGGFLVRLQGVGMLMSAREQMARGETPAVEILEGFVLLMCGAMLLLPGFVTDAIGFLLLIPPLRRLTILGFIKRRAGNIHMHTSSRVYEADDFYRDNDNRQINSNSNAHSGRSRIIDADEWQDDSDGRKS